MIHVVCLIIVDPDNFFLATQRPAEKSLGLHWEFPGGKVEPGESPEQALRREIDEELALCVGELERLPDSVHRYDFGAICLTPFLHQCTERPEFVLTEHNDFCWVDPLKWKELLWAPADIPIVENFINGVCVYE
jgi:8-oxo-dGTP diphosphatase